MAITETPGYIYLLQNQTSNTTTDGIRLNFGTNRASLMIWGTWDGASVTIQTRSIPDTNDTPVWIAVRDMTNTIFVFDEDNQITMRDFVYNQYVRAVVANAGAATDLNCTIQVV